jgi:GH25 family lysozyme M1 (1,4-beta-N-acetylmuramidase)
MALGFGVDLHPQFQAGFNFADAASENYEFAVIKATQGDNFVSPGLADYFARAERNMDIVGLYHFLEAGPSGNQQADHFLRAVRRLGGPNSMLLAADFERYPEDGSRSPSNAQLKGFIARVKEATGGHPILLYSTLGFWTGGIPSGSFSQYGADALWDARVWFAEERREAPKAFYKNSWLPWYNRQPRYSGVENPFMRQFTWGGHVGGMYVDTDACLDMDRLRRMRS